MKKSYVFIIQTDDGDLVAARQKEVDSFIDEYEQANVDLDFKVIGKIAEPNGPFSLPLDFNESLIEWYSADQEKGEEFMKQVTIAITKLIM